MESDHRRNTGIILLLFLIGVYLFITTLWYDNHFIMLGLLNGFLYLAIIAIGVSFFIWLLNRGNREIITIHSIRILSIASLVFLIELLLLSSPRMGWFTYLEWNWQGKLISLFVAIAFIILWSGLSWRSIGFIVPRRGSWVRVFMVLIGVAFFSILASSSNSSSHPHLLETILFQATLPGLEEEFIYRGILWVLIAQALSGSKRIWGISISWSLMITTILFAFIHSLTIDQSFNLSFEPSLFIFTGMAGFVLGWIRSYSGSIIPTIVLHNGINLLDVIIS